MPSSFAEELSKSKNAPTIEDNPAAAVEAIESAPAGPEFLKDGAAVLPAGADPVDPKAKEAEEAAAAAAAAAKPAEKKEETTAAPKIKIGDQEFETAEAAIEYAKQLEQARREDAAFIDGVKTAKGKDDKTEEVAEKTYIQKAQDVLFENPEEALRILQEGIKKDIRTEYEQMTTQEKQIAAQKAQSEAMWNGFYSENPELSESKEIVDFLVKKNWDSLKDLPHKQALEKVAEMSRAQLKITKEATLPKKELHSGPVVMPGASSTATTQENSPAPQEKLSFTDQLKTLRKQK